MHTAIDIIMVMSFLFTAITFCVVGAIFFIIHLCQPTRSEIDRDTKVWLKPKNKSK